MKLTIEAFSYPKQFRVCLGRRVIANGLVITGQTRQSFGFCFRTIAGNAEEGNDYSYKIYIVYGCLASPSEETNNTINETPEIKTLSWEISTTPEVVEGFKPTAMFVFDGALYKKAGLMNVLHAIENILYGMNDDEYILDSNGEAILDNEGEKVKSFGSDPHLPSLAEIRDCYAYQAFALGSDDDPIQDSSGRKIRTFVTE